MNNELQELTQKWMSLTPREEADKYYNETMMDLIKDVFVENNQEYLEKHLDNKIEYLVVTVGKAYAPIVLTLTLTSPKKILFLYTEESENTLDEVFSFIKLSSRQYEKKLVHQADPMDIYREIRNIYLVWDRPKYLYIDISGGTKVMSTAAALAGAMIDAQLMYVSSNYLKKMGAPEPGSEHLVLIENPISVFGEMERDKALELFKKFNFTGAAGKMAKLKESIPDPEMRQELNFVYLLAAAYENWDSLEFEKAYEHMSTLKEEIERDRRLHKDFLLVDQVQRIQKQCEILAALKQIPKKLPRKGDSKEMVVTKNIELLKDNAVMVPLMFTMLQSADTRAEQGKYDIASLLIYRLLEMIAQRRLIAYELYVSAMDYKNAKIDPGLYKEEPLNVHAEVSEKQMPKASGSGNSAVKSMSEDCIPEKTALGSVNRELSPEERVKWLEEKVRSIHKELYPKDKKEYGLEEKVTLLDGYIILAALDDQIVKDKKRGRDNFLKHISSMVNLRNTSILAHGLAPVSKKNYENFKELVVDCFKHYCQLENIDYQTERQAYEWILPQQSDNYRSAAAGR